MSLAIIVQDGARKIVHSVYGTREPWMTSAYNVVDVSGAPNIQAGWFQNADGSFSAPAPISPAVPTSISRRQFYQQLAAGGDITQSEALAAMAGTIPTKITTAIASLPAAQQFSAQMMAAGATDFLRANTVVSALGGALGKTNAQLDAIWTAAASL